MNKQPFHLWTINPYMSEFSNIGTTQPQGSLIESKVGFIIEE